MYAKSMSIRKHPLFSNFKNIVITLLFTLIVTLLIINNNKDTLVGYEEHIKVMDEDEQIQAYRDAYLRFKAIDILEVHTIFNKLFFYMDYKLGGDPRYDQIDCSSGMWEFFRHMGSNIKLENSISMYDRFVKSKISMRRKKLSQVQPKDLIFFREREVNGIQIGHVGLIDRVIDTPSFKGVRFIELGSRTRGLGTQVVRFISLQNKDWRIKGIYQITEDFWFGELWDTQPTKCRVSQYEFNNEGKKIL